jgi:phage shock protein A
VRNCIQETQDAEQQLPVVSQELQQLQEQEHQLTRTMRELEAKYDQAHSVARDMKSQNKILQACMQLKEERNLGVLVSYNFNIFNIKKIVY